MAFFVKWTNVIGHINMGSETYMEGQLKGVSFLDVVAPIYIVPTNKNSFNSVVVH